MGELVGVWERACVRACVCVYIVIVKYFPLYLSGFQLRVSLSC